MAQHEEGRRQGQQGPDRGPGKLPPDILEEKGDDWERAASKNRNAWCNYKSYDWDAHIIDLDDL